MHYTQGRNHALVIGASVAGLVAARALADSYERVTVIDRDILPRDPQPRRGTPQSRQAHALLTRGRAALDELFPGFSDEMIAAGGVPGDSQGDFRWYLDGYPLRPTKSGLTAIALSRPAVEHLIRARVAALPGIDIIDSTEVLGLLTDDSLRVTGVQVRGRTPGVAESAIAADLVVDATGRGSRARRWIEDLGYPTPVRSEVRIDVAYVSRHYRGDPQRLDGRLGAYALQYPGQLRGGSVLRQEGDRFIVTLAGLLGEDPPTGDAEMLAFAESLPTADIAEVIRSAKPLDEPVKMRYPASVRNRYENLDRYLDGFLVVGDALCSFNPVYAQGMTVAALEALLLRKLLADGTRDLPRRFFRAAAKLINIPWSLAVGGDLRFPQVEGARRPTDRLINKYLARYRAAASVDARLGTTFLRVGNLLDPPARLLSPGHVIRVLRSAKKAVKGAGSDTVGSLATVEVGGNAGLDSHPSATRKP